MAGLAGRLITLTHGLWLITALDREEPVQGFDAALVRRHRRRRSGHRSKLRLAIIDMQCVTCIGMHGPRGSNGAERLVGRNRVALVDAEGHVLALAVVPANVQDCDTLPALSASKEPWPSSRLDVVDGAFTAERCRDCRHLQGMRHRVVGNA